MVLSIDRKIIILVPNVIRDKIYMNDEEYVKLYEEKIREELQKRNILMPITSSLRELYRRLVTEKIKEIRSRYPHTQHTVNDHTTLRFGAIIGSGGQGVVLECSTEATDGAHVCKISPYVAGIPTTPHEFETLLRLHQQGIPVPRPLARYHLDDAEVFVMEAMNTSLRKLFKTRQSDCSQPTGAGFTRDEVKAIFQRLLPIFEKLHKGGDIFVDVKPDNIMTDFNTDPHQQQLYLIDTAMVRRVKDGPRGGGAGTPTYMSIAAHEGKELGPASDLQALGYMGSHFFNGELPWSKYFTKPDGHRICRQILRLPQTAEITRKEISECIYRSKQSIMPEELAEDFPALTAYLTYVLYLKQSDVPDYEYLKSLFA